MGGVASSIPAPSLASTVPSSALATRLRLRRGRGGSALTSTDSSTSGSAASGNSGSGKAAGERGSNREARRGRTAGTGSRLLATRLPR
jgi:hypothetical protein